MAGPLRCSARHLPDFLRAQLLGIRGKAQIGIDLPFGEEPLGFDRWT